MKIAAPSNALARTPLSEMAHAHAAAAIDALADIAAKGESENARISAAVALLDRAYGKPPQATEPTVRDGEPTEAIDRSAYEIARRIAFALTLTTTQITTTDLQKRSRHAQP